MGREINEILKQIGCSEGMTVPVANERNQNLQKEVEEKLRRKADAILKLELADERVASLKKHLQNLSQEKDQNQQLLTAHQSQLDTEYSLLQQTTFNLSKTQQDIRNFKKNMDTLISQQEKLQKEIVSATKRLNQLKALVEWGEEARLAWEEDLRKKERNTLLLENSKLQDQSQFEEMERKRQHLKALVLEREKILSNEVSEIAVLENQLEQTSTLFRKANEDRRKLIEYWNDAIIMLRQRDNNINCTLEETHNLREEARSLYAVLTEERKFYESQVQNNEELEKQLRDANYKVLNQHQLNADITQTRDSIKKEVIGLQCTLSDLGNALNTQRKHNFQINTEIQSKKEQLERIKSENEHLKLKLHNLGNENISAAQRTMETEKLMKIAEKTSNENVQRLEKLQSKFYHHNQELQSLKITSSLQMRELQTFKNHKEAYLKQANEINKEIIRKEQLLYELEMELVQLDGMLGHVQGERSSEEKEKNRIKVLELEQIHKKKMEVYNMINSQYTNAKDTHFFNFGTCFGCLTYTHLQPCSKCQTCRVRQTPETCSKIKKKEHFRISSVLEEDAETLKMLTAKRQDRIYLVEGASKELVSVLASNEQKLVQHNLLKLRVDQVEKNLAKEGECVFSLQKQKLELESAMQARKIEISAQKEIMMTKKHCLLEEKSELRKTLEQSNLRIAQLQKRYDIAVDSIGKEDTGEQFSVAHFKIKMAQEKHELQEKGDQLDAKIKKAEKEIISMENTLKLINASNDCYKHSLDSIDADSPEMYERKDLETQYNAASEILKQKELELKDINANIQDLELALLELCKLEGKLKTEWQEKDTEARQLSKELCDQQGKLNRAEKLLKKLIKEVRAMKEPHIPVHIAEKDIELRRLAEINQSALQKLAELTVRHLETSPVINRYLSEKNLTLPVVHSSSSSLLQTKISGSSGSLNQSVLSDASSRLSVSSGSSCAPSVVNLDPSLLSSPAGTSSRGRGDNTKSSYGKKSKHKPSK